MKLKNRQRGALLVGLLVAVVMGLYPPWEQKVGTSRYRALGYHLIVHEFLPDTHNNDQPIRPRQFGPAREYREQKLAEQQREQQEQQQRQRDLSRIDTTLLWVQWLTVAFATAAAVTLLGDWGVTNIRAIRAGKVFNLCLVIGILVVVFLIIKETSWWIIREAGWWSRLSGS